VDWIDRVRDPNQMEEFIPDIKALHQAGGRNAQFKALLGRWYYTGGRAPVRKLAKDPDAGIAADAAKVLDEEENPSARPM
jgi:hypothetical protein